jgi:hypothetical protein
VDAFGPSLATSSSWQELIYRHAKDMVAEFPDGSFKARMTAALPSLRIPYWDAAAVPPVGTGSYPCKCTVSLPCSPGVRLNAAGTVQRKTIEVELPSGKGSVRRTIPNPLFSYTFHPTPGKALFVSHRTQSSLCLLTSGGEIPMDPLANDTPIPYRPERQCPKPGLKDCFPA